MRTKIICLCGSTKFKEAFESAILTESSKGHVVLSVACFTHHDGIQITEAQKITFDALHLRKIEMSDQILVLNVGGYIGESTKREIAHATSLGKEVCYLENTHVAR